MTALVTCICPSCGFNLEADKPIERDGWRIDPRMPAIEYLGVSHAVRLTWVAILHCICSSRGVVSTDALLNRISDSEDPKVIFSNVSQLKRWLRSKGLVSPIRGLHRCYGGGYVWWPDPSKPRPLPNGRNRSPAGPLIP